MKNLRYQIIGASNVRAVGKVVIDADLLRVAKLPPELWRIKDFASDALVLRLASAKKLCFNESASLPQDAETESPPQDSESESPPQDGESECLPQDGETESPPQDSETESPPRDGESASPPQDGETESPPKGSGSLSASSQQ